MVDLVEWLRAQLDEDEQIALSAREGPWAVRFSLSGEDEIYSVPRDEQHGGDSNVFPDVWHEGSTAHAIRHDPSRVLREVAAKRWILAQHPHVRFARMMADWNDADVKECPQAFPGSDRPWVGCKVCDYDPHYEQVDPHTWCGFVRTMAAVYSHRPGYLPEWAPETGTPWPA
jgi:hypothetical protein